MKPLEQKKHREIFAKTYPNGDFTGACTVSQTDKPSIRMIEYSALLEMEKRAEELKAKLQLAKDGLRDVRKFPRGEKLDAHIEEILKKLESE